MATLRVTYVGAQQIALAAAKAAGTAWIVSNKTAIELVLDAAADQGETTATYTAAVAYQPNDLYLKSNLWDAFKSGILQQLFTEEIYNSEVTVTITQTSTNPATTNISIVFSF